MSAVTNIGKSPVFRPTPALGSVSKGNVVSTVAKGKVQDVLQLGTSRPSLSGQSPVANVPSPGEMLSSSKFEQQLSDGQQAFFRSRAELNYERSIAIKEQKAEQATVDVIKRMTGNAVSVELLDVHA